MKNSIISFILLFGFAINSNAVCDSTHATKKHELGLMLYSNELEYFTLKDGDAFSQNFIPGIQYKLKLNKKNAVRASLRFNYKKTNILNDGFWDYYYKENSLTKGLQIKTGYEHSFLCGRLKPFIFSDLSYSFLFTDGYKEWWGDFSWGQGNFQKTENDIGIVAGLGVKYNLYNRIFLSLEIAETMNYVFMYEKTEGYNPYSDHFIDFRFNPVNMLAFGVKF